ncbi:HAMP domain-containing histidine kinase [bacterium]|nr:HAMP domain-containing histidine kinase [bacterium]MBU1991014.1 HAMP domain-containing histidine kinase [bacterium]
MFRNLRLSIFIYYLLTASAFLGILHYFLAVVQVENVFLLAVILLSLVVLSGVMISKLAIDPLEQYTRNLQNLSKETLHELNLPISTIMTNSHMLKKNMTNEKDLKRMLRIESACAMLSQRYNELEYMIKTQSRQEINETFDLKTLVKNRVDFLQQIYPHIQFELDLQDTQITNDKIGLSKVIDNIIDNGVKYSPISNKIEIKLNDFKLSIKDYGCGMDEVELIQIFDNYYQANENMQGFGIGLSMVKRFCDTHGILLNIKSKPNVGTTLTLKFKDN